MKLAVFLPNWVGDVVMATPALRALREHFTSAEIVGIARPQLLELLQGTGLLDRVLPHNPKGANAGQRGWAFYRSLQQEALNLLILFPNSWRSAWWAWASGASRRVGFERHRRGCLLTDALPSAGRRNPRSTMDDYLKLVAHLGCDIRGRQPELQTSPHDELRIDRFWWKQPSVIQKYGTGRSYICLNTGGAYGPAKNWPDEAFADLARKIAWKLDRRVLVVCGPAERDAARRIVELADHPAVVSLAEEDLSLGLTKAAIRRAELLVTTDSGPRHFAHPFNVPCVTLFGPTDPRWSETRHPLSAPVQLKVDCGPCQKRVCPLGHHKCLKDLSVDHVFRSVCQLLDQTQLEHSQPLRRVA